MKKKIGITYGCFDLFHIGHLNFLRQCKRCCDKLIVGIFTDKMIFNYKDKYPIIPFEQRVRIIAELQCVDAVIKINHRIADDLTGFDFLFVSNKLINKQLYMLPDKWKGDVIYIPRTKNISSTIIKEKIKNEL